MWPFRRRNRYSIAPDDFDREALWRGENAPPVELIETITRGMPVTSPKWKGMIVPPIERTLDQTVNWAKAYGDTECVDLQEWTVQNPGKHFELVFMTDRECSTFYFRLMTKGLDGSTMYTISWRRIGDDAFLCAEG